MGFDSEIKKACRKIGDNPKEFSEEWVIQGDDFDEALVKFEEQVHVVSCLTMGDVKKMFAKPCTKVEGMVGGAAAAAA